MLVFRQVLIGLSEFVKRGIEQILISLQGLH